MSIAKCEIHGIIEGKTVPSNDPEIEDVCPWCGETVKELPEDDPNEVR